MNVASIELCRELYELSWWRVTQFDLHYRLMAAGTEYERYEVTQQGDVLAELDNGFLYVWDKNMAWNSVSYVPKSRVINTEEEGE